MKHQAERKNQDPEEGMAGQGLEATEVRPEAQLWKDILGSLRKTRVKQMTTHWTTWSHWSVY